MDCLAVSNIASVGSGEVGMYSCTRDGDLIWACNVDSVEEFLCVWILFSDLENWGIMDNRFITVETIGEI